MSAQPAPSRPGGISNGMLLAMKPENRARVIAGLSLAVRGKLAEIAELGAAKLNKDAASLLADGRLGFAQHKLDHAAEFAGLLDELTQKSA